MTEPAATDRIYLRDAQIRAFDAAVVAVGDDGRVALDATAFYATGGGQPHDTGTISWDGRHRRGDRRAGLRRGLAQPQRPGARGGRRSARPSSTGSAATP